jgi:hypothetical protein
MSQHKCDYKRWINGNYKGWITSFILYQFDEEVHIELLEEIDFKDKKELQKLEQSYIDKYRDDCVNERQLCRYNNKIKCRKYYNKNKERLNKKITCDCGSIYSYKGKNRHLKSKKHIDYINTL